VSAQIYRRGDVHVKTILFFTDRVTLELNSLWLRAYKKHKVLWTIRCCACRVVLGQGDSIVVSSSRRTVAFNGESPGETKAWFKALKLAFSKDFSRFMTLTRELGSGAFAKVYLGEPKERGAGGSACDAPPHYAVKVIDKTKAARQWLVRLRREIDIQQKLKHDSVVTLHDSYESGTSIYMVLEFVEGGVLVDKLMEMEIFMEEDVVHIMRQLLEGVAFLHSKGIVHRDLKLDNVLVQDMSQLKIKIADFGLSGQLFNETDTSDKVDIQHLKSFVGTPKYMAPEIDGVSAYDQSVDIWALGVIMYALLSGEFPFNEEDNELASFARVSFHRDCWSEVTEEAKSLICSMLTRRPEERVTAADALKHPWFCSKVSFSDTVLSVDFSKLRESEMRFKKVVHSIIALHKLQKIASSRQIVPEVDPYLDTIDDDLPKT